MTEALETRKKERSPSFPFISLAVALQRAREFFDAERRGGAPYEVAARHWSYSPSSSGALQTVAALKQYGLMIDEGAGSQRKVRLTDLALRVLLDTREDATEREQLKRQAALNPPVVAQIYEKWGGDLPSDATLHHFLVLDREFSPQTATKAVSIIKENESFTAQSQAASISDMEKLSGDTMEATGTASTLSRAEMGGGSAMSRPGATLVRTERFIGPSGIDIVLQFSAEPTADAYEFIKDYVELQMKRLKPKPASGGGAA